MFKRKTIRFITQYNKHTIQQLYLMKDDRLTMFPVYLVD